MYASLSFDAVRELPLWSLRLVFSLTLLWLLAGVAVLLLQKSSAAVRHRAWALSVVAALLLPLLLWLVPEMRLGWVDLRYENADRGAGEVASVGDIAHASQVQSEGEIADNATHAPAAAEAIQPSDRASIAIAALADVALTDAGTTHSIATETGPPSRGHDLATRGSSAWWLLLLTAPTIWGLSRIARALRVARQIVARSQEIADPGCRSLLCEVAQRFAHPAPHFETPASSVEPISASPPSPNPKSKIENPKSPSPSVRLLQSAHTPVPLCVGWRNPAIILPADWPGWTPDTLRAVLAHEMSHVLRRDVAWQLLALVACALYWFHPLAWLAARRMRTERETACDDGVLRSGENPAAYARILVDLAGRLNTTAAVPYTSVAMAARCDLEHRVRAVLAANRSRAAVGKLVNRTLTIAALGLVATVGMLNPFGTENTNRRAAAADESQQAPVGSGRYSPGEPEVVTTAASAQEPNAKHGKLEGATRRSPNPLVAVMQPPAPGARLDAAGEPMPEGMVQRLGSTRFKVPGWWRRLAFAANDEWIWIKADQHVSAIHRESGRVVKQHQLRLGEGSVWSVAASADGRQVAIAMSNFQHDAEMHDYRVVVISAHTTQHLHEFEWKAPASELCGLSFSGDGKRLLTATERNDVRLWNLETGQLLRPLVIDRSRSRHAAISPDGKTAVLAGWDGAFYWKVDGTEEPMKLPTRSVYSVCFAPNGKMFATITDDGARLWNATTGEQLAFFAAEVKRTYSAADFGIAFTPDSRLLAVPANRLHRIDLWDVESKQRIATLPVHRPRGLAISRNGRWLAASGDEQFTTIFDLQTHQTVNQPGDGHSDGTLSVRFANEDTLVTSGYGDARVWSIQAGKQQHSLLHEAKDVAVRGLATSPDGALIVTSGYDDTLGVWERKTGNRLYTLQGHGRVGGTRAVRFTPDSRQIVSWGDDAVLRRWNVFDGSLAAAYTLDLPGVADPGKGDGRLDSSTSTIAPDTRSLFVRLEEQLYEFETATGKRLRQVPVSRDMAPLAVSPDNRWIAAGEIQREANGAITAVNVVLRDRRTLEVVRDWSVSDLREDESDAQDNRAAGHKPAMSFVGQNDNGISFSPDSKLLAWSRLGSRSGVDIAEIQRDRPSASIPVESPCWCVEFSPDGTRIATGHYDSTISVWSRTHPAFALNSGGRD